MKKYKKKKFIIYGLIIICCLILVIYFLLFYKYYNPKSSIKKLNKFKSVESKSAVGWIKIQGTNIDMPVMYYYDVEDIGNPTYDIGWTFNDSKEKTSKIIVYSHNMKNVSSHPLIANKEHGRFEQLMSFIYTSFIEKNKYIQYTVDGKDYLYKIYAVSFEKTEELDNNEGNMSAYYKEKYINDRQIKSYFKMDTEVSKKDNLLTLITCTRFFGATQAYSFVVDAREVRENEKIRNYKVLETEQYKPIKEILEGDGKNE